MADDNEIINLDNLTRGELIIILGAIANSTPSDKELEKKLHTIYYKLKYKLHPPE